MESENRFEIEEAWGKAEELSSVLFAVTQAIYNGTFDVSVYEQALFLTCNLAYKLSEYLQKLTFDAFEKV